MKTDIWTDELLAMLDANDAELNNSMCECGARLGDHSHEGRLCPNPNDGPLYLERTFVDMEYSAKTMQLRDVWYVARGANA